MDTVRDFYKLSEILNDDLYQIAKVIQSYSSKEVSISELEDLNLKEYAKVISCILDLSVETIQNIGNGVRFESESDYIQYLQHLLKYSGVEFIPFVRLS